MGHHIDVEARAVVQSTLPLIKMTTTTITDWLTLLLMVFVTTMVTMAGVSEAQGGVPK